MKKILIILLALCMITALIPFTVSADGATDLLNADTLKHQVGSDRWTFTDGELVANNRDLNDAAYMTDIKIEKGQHVYIEATAKYEGLAWGIIFSENGVANPFDRWFCLNVDYDNFNSRLFCINTATTTGTPYQPQIHVPNVRDGQYHTLGIEILENGAMKLYLDGEMHTYLENAKFEGAHLGIMTCRANVNVKSFTMKDGAPTHTTVRDTTPRALEYSSTVNLIDNTVLKHSVGGAQFNFADDKITTNFNGGDKAIMSEIFVNPGDHVYIEATGKVTQGNAWGIILGEAGFTNAFDRWVCINVSVDVFKSRIFAPNAQCNVATPYEYFYYSADNARNEEITLGLEITPDGTFYMTCNGVTYAQNKATTWNGGYVGLMTWESAVEFTNATYNVVSGLAPVETTLEDNGVSVTGLMTPGAKLEAQKITEGEAYNALAAALTEDEEAIGAYDIKISDGRADGKINVTFNVGTKYNGSEITVVVADGTENERISATCKRGKVTVELDGEATVLLAQVTEKEDNAETGDITAFIVMTLVISAIGCAYFARKRQRI